jgi:hypothetical protein
MTGTPDNPLPEEAKIVLRELVELGLETVQVRDLKYAELRISDSGLASQEYADRLIVWCLQDEYCRSDIHPLETYDNRRNRRKPVISENEPVIARDCPECGRRVERRSHIEFKCSLTDRVCDAQNECGQSGDCRTCFVALVNDLDLDGKFKKLSEMLLEISGK